MSLVYRHITKDTFRNFFIGVGKTIKRKNLRL